MRIRLRGVRGLAIRIWKDTQAVTIIYKCQSASGSSVERDKNIAGFYISKEGGGAEIHLALPLVGYALWAHELQHFMAGWCKTMGWDATEFPYDERAAKLAERITRQFWIWFHKNFPLDK